MTNVTVSTPRASSTGVPIYFDVSQLRALEKDFLRASKEASRALREGMTASARLVARDAEARVSYSKRIPGSIKTRVGRTNFRLSAGGDAAPNAAPIENKGKGFVRHPVFASPNKGRSEWTWTDKHSRPAFLAPALDAKADEVVATVEKAVGDAVQIAIEGHI